MDSVFLLKLVLVPLLIGIMTLVARRWGPALAGWLSGFPVFAGPVLLIIALEQGVPFTTVAAGGALGAVLGNALFCVVYAWASTRYGWWLCLIVGYSAYALIEIIILRVGLPNPILYVLTVCLLWGAVRVFPKARLVLRAAPPLWPELPIRMVSSGVLVVAITVSAASLGPQISGLLSAVPLLATILAVFSQVTLGHGAAIQLLRGMVSGFYALATFCFVLTFSLAQWGIALGFTAALLGAVLAQAISLKLQPPRALARQILPEDVASGADGCIPKSP